MDYILKRSQKWRLTTEKERQIEYIVAEIGIKRIIKIGIKWIIEIRVKSIVEIEEVIIVKIRVKIMIEIWVNSIKGEMAMNNVNKSNIRYW